MKAGKIIGTLLVAFVMFSLGYLFYVELVQPKSPGAGATPGSAAGAPIPDDASVKGRPGQVIAYYFHGHQRCPTCRKLEAYSQEAIESGFGEALKDGRLEWRVVNVEEEGNGHFIKDYQLYSKSLVLVRVVDGKQAEWKNLTRIWELVGDKPSFVEYVQEEVSSYLKP